MFDEETINDLVEDITSWGRFFIIVDGESQEEARNFCRELEDFDISSFVIIEGMEDEFRKNLNEDDTVLVISKLGNEDFIKGMVKTALVKNIGIYAICSDFRSHLSILAEESIIINETEEFKENLKQIFNRIYERISSDSEEDTYEISNPIPCAPINDNSIPPECKLTSPLQAMVIDIKVKVGDRVKKGDLICVLEAMKMENDVFSDKEGIIEYILVEPNDGVNIGDTLMIIKL